MVWVGRRASASWEGPIADYEERLKRLTRFSQLRIRPAAGRDGDPARALAQEAAAIARVLRERDLVVALDEGGRQFDSEGFSSWLSAQAGMGRVVFVVGSDLGLDATVKRLARERLSLSPMTLPHPLARLVLLEQLYRVLDMQAGGGYHRGD